MDSLAKRDLFLYVVLAIFILYTLKVNKIIGVSKETKKAKHKVTEEIDKEKNRRRWEKFLECCEWVALNIGYQPKDAQRVDIRYRVGRLDIQVKALGREWKDIEFIGLMKAIQTIGLIGGTLVVMLTGNVGGMLLYLLFLTPMFFKMYSDETIRDEDKELERDFPDLYLLLYGRLKRGSQARLAPTLSDFEKSLKVMTGEKEKKVIKKFVRDFRNLIEIYSDESIALDHLRLQYRSAMVINFINLASQCLRDKDTDDKLLSFKMELLDVQKTELDKESDRRINLGEKSLFVIYVILFQFVILSMLSKLGTMGGF